MASPITNAFIETFNENVHQQYQGKMRLKDCVRMETNVIGESHSFPIMESGLARLRGAASSDLVPIDGDTNLRKADLEDWDATQFVDDFEQFNVNWSIQQQYIMKISKAIGRRLDQIIIDALNDSTSTKSVATNISGSVSNLTVDAIRDAGRQLDDDEVDEMDRFFAFSSRAKQGLLGETEATSTDFVSVKALTEGSIDSFYGFKFKMIGGNRAENGLPIASNVRTNFAWHMDSIGLAMNDDVRTRIGYSDSKGSYVVRSYFSAGAIDIDPLGIVDVLTSEA